MVGKNEETEKSSATDSLHYSDSIILLDTLTLAKISEFKVSTFNSVHSEATDYNEGIDFYSPEEADTCKTSYNFPKYVCWGQGTNLLVGIGAKPKSKVFYEFRVYDANTKRLQQTIIRSNRSNLSGCIMEVNNHPSNDDILVFTMKNSTTEYSIVEFNVFTNSMVDEMIINAHDIDFVKVNENLTKVYLAKFQDRARGSYQGSHKLYALDYGTDHNLTTSADEYDDIGDLGSSIYASQIIGTSILVKYRKIDDTEMIETFNDNDTYPVRSNFTLYGDHTFMIDSKTRNVFCWNQEYNGYYVYLLGKDKPESHWKFPLTEFEYFRFQYPNVLMLKGGLEIVMYDFKSKEFTYLKLPAPIIITMKDQRNTMTFMGLTDTGDEYLSTFFGYKVGYGVNINQAVISYSRRKITKSRLKSNERIISYLGMFDMVSGQAAMQGAQKEEEKKESANNSESCFLILVSNYLVGINDKEDEAAKYYRFRYEPDEIIVMPTDSYEINKKNVSFTLMYYKKYQKRISILPSPIDLSRNSSYTLYDSPDLIKNVVMSKPGYEQAVFYIADEFKYLKEWDIKIINNMPRLDEKNEFFVHQYFTGEAEFSVKQNSFLYCYDEWVTMQKKPNVNEEMRYSVFLGLTDGYVFQPPIYSNESVMLAWEKYGNSEHEILVMPGFKKSRMPLTSAKDSSSVVKEFYFYSKSMDEEFVVHMREEGGYPFCILLDFYRKNGEFIYTKRHEVNNIKNAYNYVEDPEYDNSSIKISPNGKFMYYITTENNPDYDPYGQNNIANQSSEEEVGRRGRK